MIEWQTIVSIFEHGAATGFSPSDYNLPAILSAEDDDSPGVPEIGCEGALIDLIERISNTNLPNSIHAPELRQLLLLFEKAFGREVL